MPRYQKRGKKARLYLVFALFFLLLFNLPHRVVETLRLKLVDLREGRTKKDQGPLNEDLHALLGEAQRENHRLAVQNHRLKEELFGEKALQRRVDWIEKIQGEKGKKKAFFQRRCQEALALLDLELQALSAKVIYRDTGAWHRSFWINVGERDNQTSKSPLIGVNSPVLLGPYLIGIIERVEKSRSRVRLITDGAVVVGVRAVREKDGRGEMRRLLDLVDEHQICEGEEEVKLLDTLRARCAPTSSDAYLAKGELCGGASATWRRCSTRLIGRGFNYDFSDEEGPARHLRSGQVIGAQTGVERTALIQEGDLLVTSGLDGVFPAHLPVAVVSRVFPLEAGAAWYDLEARLCAGNLEDFESVTVLPYLSCRK